MVLKRATYDGQGEVLSGFEFTQLDFQPNIRPDTFRLDIPGAKIVTPQDRLNRMAHKYGFPMLGLPNGSPFRLDGGRMMKVGKDDVLVQMYSGPGGRFSVFRVHGTVNPADVEKKARGLRTLSWVRNGETIVIVGDIDEATLQSVSRQFGYAS
jgi:negative regulator of sigma E activity